MYRQSTTKRGTVPICICLLYKKQTYQYVGNKQKQKAYGPNGLHIWYLKGDKEVKSNDGIAWELRRGRLDDKSQELKKKKRERSLMT